MLRLSNNANVVSIVVYWRRETFNPLLFRTFIPPAAIPQPPSI
jgi:hypothetical protein